ncbi:MAG: EAL domain-containing protein [Thiogranum sp.]|nr:EAL domain-containing protein [Thiogranum sp.]
MNAGFNEHKIASLSTKITVIVFWGLIFVGLIFAAILFNNLEESTQGSREALADNIAYRIHETLDHANLEDNPRLSGELVQLNARYPDLFIELGNAGTHIASVGSDPGERDSQSLSRIIRITQPDGGMASAELLVRFPDLEAALHEQRTPLLIGLGMLLLLFGSVMKGLLDHILSRPLTKMVATARDISEGKAGADVVFDDTRNDEFGYVSRFINEAVTTMRASRQQAWEAKELAEVTLLSITDGVVTTDRQGRVAFMNPVVQHMLGVSLHEARGRPLRDTMLIVDENTGKEISNPVTQCVYENRSIELDDNCAILRSDDQAHPVEISASPICGEDGEVRGAVLVLHDVREARALQRELSYQASHDPLTGLYNRREFDRELQRALEHTRRDGEEHALCYLDLDQFKVVNDTCGHAAGDLMLQKLTADLRASLRKADVLARLGGDEFGILLAHCAIDRAVDVAEALRKTISEFRFVWGDKSFQVNVSIGLVPVTRDQSCTAEILSAADMACYAAKEEGRNRVHIFQPDDEHLRLRRNEMGMVSAVRRALAEDRFELFAQPIVSTRGDDSVHYELLVRMLDEDNGYVAPGAFLPAAERYQLMSDIDRWVISDAIRLLLEQEAAGRTVNISINLSGQSIGEKSFLDFVTRKVERLGLSARQVCFEITETVAVNNLGLALKFIETIRRFGCQFSLDDFGAGVSSFGYLKNLPVDYVKIDGVFIRSIHDNEVDQAMVKAIAQVAGVMGMRTIAEFVENRESFELLRDMGIDYAQGYWIEKPQPAREVFGNVPGVDNRGMRLVKSGPA